MNIAFVIERTSYFINLSSLIQEALDNGHNVFLLHDYGQSKIGVKGYLFPYIESSPSNFKHKICSSYSYTNDEEFIHLINEYCIQIVFSVTPLPNIYQSLDHKNICWILINLNHDLAFSTSAEGLLISSDIIAWQTSYWLNHALSYYKSTTGLLQDKEQEIRDKSIFVGNIWLDRRVLAQKETVKKRLGIVSHKGIVSYFNYPSQSIPKDLYNHVFSTSSNFKRLMKLLLLRRFDQWRNIWMLSSEQAVVEAIRKYCDQNNLLFVVKGREKNKIPKYIEKNADYIFYDQSMYPATSLDILSISKLNINYYSMCTLESVFFGVKTFCIDAISLKGKMSLLFNLHKNSNKSLFNFQKIVTSTTPENFTKLIYKCNTDDELMDNLNFNEYEKKYISDNKIYPAPTLISFVENYFK